MSRGRPRRMVRAATSRRAADYIRELVLSGELRADERIDQERIAADLGVSRLPVREALIALGTEGVVSAEPHRGTYVVPIREADIADHYFIYGRVQGLAARRATALLTADELDRLENLNSRIDSSTNERERRDLDWEFHSTINRCGGSGRLVSTLRQMNRSLPAQLYGIPPSLSASSARQHVRILEALRSGDAEGAERALIEHTRSEGTHLVHVLRVRNVIDEEASAKDGTARNETATAAASDS